MLFRHGNGGPSWHFCRNCSGWPEQDYQEETQEPSMELICAECTRRLIELQCEPWPEEPKDEG